MRALLVLAVLALLEVRLAHAAAQGWLEVDSFSDKVEADFDSSACVGDPSGKAYVSLYTLVFAFPGVRSIGGTVDRYYERNAADAPLHRRDRYAPWPTPLDPAQPDGCPEHPAQRDSYEIEGAKLAALLGAAPDPQHPDLDVGGDSVELAPNFGRTRLGSGPLAYLAKSSGPYCGPKDAEIMARRARISACLYRSGDDWIGSGMTKPAAPEVSAVPFSCEGRCMIRVIFEPDLFLLAYHRVNAASPKSPIEQMTDFQQRLWTALEHAEVRNYQWRTAPGAK